MLGAGGSILGSTCQQLGCRSIATTPPENEAQRFRVREKKTFFENNIAFGELITECTRCLAPQEMQGDEVFNSRIFPFPSVDEFLREIGPVRSRSGAEVSSRAATPVSCHLSLPVRSISKISSVSFGMVPSSTSLVIYPETIRPSRTLNGAWGWGDSKKVSPSVIFLKIYFNPSDFSKHVGSHSRYHNRYLSRLSYFHIILSGFQKTN